MTQLPAAVKWCVRAVRCGQFSCFAVELGTVCVACGTRLMSVSLFRNNIYLIAVIFFFFADVTVLNIQ
jgi:hypothetical protein